MTSFVMLCPVALVGTDVLEERSASIFRVTRVITKIQYKNKYFVFLRSVRRLLVMTIVVPSSPILVTVMMEALSSYKSHTA
jgi:hypothetical protein